MNGFQNDWTSPWEYSEGIKDSVWTRLNVQIQKKSILTLRKVIGNSLGEGGRGVKILEAKYEAKL